MLMFLSNSKKHLPKISPKLSKDFSKENLRNLATSSCKMLVSQFPGPPFFKIKKTEQVQIDVRIGQPLARRGTRNYLTEPEEEFLFRR